jgi:putative nucleotidyltransferase with HDIG domain
MGFVSVDDLEQGMVLSADVRDINSRLLLCKGQKIANSHMRVLKIWGVSEVNVVGGARDQAPANQGLDPEKLTKAKIAVDAVFKNLNRADSAINEVYQLSILYRYRNNMLGLPETGSHPTEARLAFSQQALSKKIDSINMKLPEAPTIIAELNQVISDPLASSNDVAQVVHKSPSLASHLLRVVNSACYGFPSRIDRISRAVTLIGTREISGLALGLCVLQTFKDISPTIIDMQAFTRHSMACGIVARIFAALNNMPHTEQMFVSGLLHDIGKLIFYKYFASDAKTIFDQAAASDQSVLQVEKAVLGISHTQTGKYLLRKWKLPRDLEDNVMFHHNPSRAPDPVKAAIVQMADLITNGTGIAGSGERIIPGFDAQAWQASGIANATIRNVVRQAEHQLAPLETILS